LLIVLSILPRWRTMRVVQQTGHVARRVETGEGAAEVFALGRIVSQFKPL